MSVVWDAAQRIRFSYYLSTRVEKEEKRLSCSTRKTLKHDHGWISVSSISLSSLDTLFFIFLKYFTSFQAKLDALGWAITIGFQIKIKIIQWLCSAYFSNGSSAPLCPCVALFTHTHTQQIMFMLTCCLCDLLCNYMTSSQAVIVYECLSEWAQILCAICPNPKLVITGGTSTAICVWETSPSKEKAKTLTLKQVKEHKLLQLDLLIGFFFYLYLLLLRFTIK